MRGRWLPGLFVVVLGCDAPAPPPNSPAVEPAAAATPEAAQPASAAEPSPRQPSTAPPTVADKPTAETVAPAGLSLDPLPLVAAERDGIVAVPGAIEGSVFVVGPSLFVAVMPADERPATLEAAKKSVTSAGSELATVEVDDGWGLTFAGRNDWGPWTAVQVRRTVGAAAWWCESRANSEAEQRAAVEFCGGLRALP